MEIRKVGGEQTHIFTQKSSDSRSIPVPAGQPDSKRTFNATQIVAGTTNFFQGEDTLTSFIDSIKESRT